MLGLNNELYRSHVDLKRRLVEMCVQAVLSDFVSDRSQVPSGSDSAAIAEHVMQWAYDLIVLDPYGNFGKKVNEPLLGNEKNSHSFGSVQRYLFYLNCCLPQMES